MAHKNKSNWSPYKERQKERQAKNLSSKNANDKNNTQTEHSSSHTHSSSQKQNQGSEPKNTLRGKHKKPTENYSLQEVNDRLFDLFRHHGFTDFPHDKRKKLAEFYLQLMETQNKENFTRLLNLRDIGIKHFIDSLIVGQLTELQFPLMDVGTGPGFPGIPLKILYPDQPILLAEGVQRRVEFLKTVRENLQLDNLLILGRNINPECFYPVRGVITRAVEDMRNTLGNVLHCLQTGGRVYFMKGPGVGPEIPVALEAWSEYYKLVDDIAYSLPNTPQERRLIIFEKIKTHIVDEEFLESLGITDQDED